jgi:hypothetical protein
MPGLRAHIGVRIDSAIIVCKLPVKWPDHFAKLRHSSGDHTLLRVRLSDGLRAFEVST